MNDKRREAYFIGKGSKNTTRNPEFRGVSVRWIPSPSSLAYDWQNQKKETKGKSRLPLLRSCQSSHGGKKS